MGERDDPGHATVAGGEPGVRLFAGVWPPPEVVRLIGELDRPEVPGVRWTTRAQWHVTLAFLGRVDEPKVDALAGALESATGSATQAATRSATGGDPARAAAPHEARLGPATTRLGRAVLCVPVAGLEELATSVRGALGVVLGGVPFDGHPFRGHLTLARAKGHRTVPATLAGVHVEARWAVTEVCLVRSELDPRGARYTTVATATVPPWGPGEIPHRTGVRR